MKTKSINGFTTAKSVTRSTVANLPENACFVAGAVVGTAAGLVLGTADLAARVIPPCCKKAFNAGLGKVKSVKSTTVETDPAPQPA